MSKSSELEKLEPEKLDLASLDIAAEKQAELLRLFPEVRTEGGKIDFDRLRLALGETVDVGKERYGMNWPGKADCFKAIQRPSLGTLLPVREESVNFDETENLIIEGDNLEVLKLLQKSYQGKVKMIYIDPPYNTGNDFIYPDNYSESLQTYLEYTGQVDSEGRKFSNNIETDGRFHSKWLNMMYPRLYLARNLLRENGAIFISTNDIEQPGLRLLCNEVFGEENFIATFVWTTKRGAQGIPTRQLVVANHEYISVFARDADKFRFLGLDRTEDGFGNPDSDPRGPWKRQYLQRFGQGFSKRLVRNPVTGMVYEFETPYTQEKIDAWILDGSIIFPSDSTSYPSRKEYLEEYENQKQLVTYLDLFPTKASTEKLYALFDGAKIFSNPKPVDLLSFLIKATTQADDVILDFFAGSGTTAQAALELSRSETNSRQFILVQLPEPTEDGTFKTIADITKERVRRVIQRQEKEAEGKLDLGNRPKEGFRVLKLATSNFNIWNAATETTTPDALTQQLELHIDHIQKGRASEDLLYEILLKSGFPLTTPVETFGIDGKAVHSVANGAMLICLALQLTHETIKGIADLKPERVVCLDEGFAGNDQLKTNAVLMMKSKGVTKFQTI